MKTKLLTLAILGLFMVSFLSLALPSVLAYSNETTGLITYGFDNSQQTYVYAGGFNIYAFANELVFYDDNAVLTKTYTLPTLAYHTNCTRAAILKVSDSLILVGMVGGNDYQDLYNHKAYLSYSIGTLDINTLGYTSISASYQDVGDWTFQSVSSVGMQGTGLVLMSNTNTTGSFYYMWFSGQVIMAGQSGSLTGGYGNFFSYVGKYITSTWTSGYSLKQSSTANIWLYTNAFAVTQNMPINYGYIFCSNNYQSGNRAVFYQVNFNTNTVSYVGTTSLDNSYTGSYVVGSAFYDGFTYLMGVATYNNKVIVNFASSQNFGSGLLVGSLIFNSSYVSQSFTTNAVTSNSYVDRPFTVTLPNSYGNISGVYGVGYFDDIISQSQWYLTGWSLTLSGLETATPTWALYQFGFEYTPQQPQTYPYSTSWSWGGFQAVGSTIGNFVDMLNGKCKANIMYQTNVAVTYNGLLTGDLFYNTAISTAPTEITLKQGITYTYTGNIYVNSFLTGDGSYSVGITPLSSSSSTAFASIPASYITASFTDGVFSFSISPRTAATTVYQKIVVNFTLSTGESYVATYNFGFYAYGSPVYPTPSTSGYLDPGMLNGGMNTFVNFLLLFLVIGGPSIMLGIKAGSAGFLGGAVMGLGIGVIANLIPFWFIFVVALGLVAVIVMWRNNKDGGPGE